MSQVIQQLTMNNGQAAHITAVVLDQNGQVMPGLNPSIIDTSSCTTFTPDFSNPAAGVVASTAVGSDTLTASYQGLVATLPVTVRPLPPCRRPSRSSWTLARPAAAKERFALMGGPVARCYGAFSLNRGHATSKLSVLRSPLGLTEPYLYCISTIFSNFPPALTVALPTCGVMFPSTMSLMRQDIISANCPAVRIPARATSRHRGLFSKAPFPLLVVRERVF